MHCDKTGRSRKPLVVNEKLSCSGAGSTLGLPVLPQDVKAQSVVPRPAWEIQEFRAILDAWPT